MYMYYTREIKFAFLKVYIVLRVPEHIFLSIPTTYLAFYQYYDEDIDILNIFGSKFLEIFLIFNFFVARLICFSAMPT